MMKLLKCTGAVVLAAVLLSSCEKADYTCRCAVQHTWGQSIEELQIGYAPNNTAQKRCMNYKLTRTEEFRGTKQVITCRVIVEE